MALESEEDKCMYAFGAALATQTDQFKKVRYRVNANTVVQRSSTRYVLLLVL